MQVMKTLGKANVRLIEGINTLGVDLADPAAQDDKVVTELHFTSWKKVISKCVLKTYYTRLTCLTLEHK